MLRDARTYLYAAFAPLPDPGTVMPHPTGTALAVAAAVSMVWNVIPPVSWLPVGMFLIALLVLMSIELGTEWWSLDARGRSEYFLHRKIVGKIMLILIIVVCFVSDVTIYYAVSVMPGEFAVLDNGFLFVTLTGLLWLIAAELVCIIKNYRAAGEGASIPPPVAMVADGIRWVIQNLKIVDKAKWQAEHPGVPLPKRRERDGLTVEQEAELALRVEEMRRENRQIPPSADEILRPEDER